jgi:hypothetical protein
MKANWVTRTILALLVVIIVVALVATAVLPPT